MGKSKKKKSERGLDLPKGYIAFELRGKNRTNWAIKGEQFFKQLRNLFARILSSRFGNRTLREEAAEFAFIAYTAVKEALKKPLIANQESIVRIRNYVADTRLKEAEADAVRKSQGKSDMHLKNEEIKKRHQEEENESVKIIEAMLKRGEIVVDEIDGRRVIIVTKSAADNE